MSGSRVLLLVAGILCLGARVQSVDCNQNGVEDALDSQPGELQFETEHAWDYMGCTHAVAGGDWNSDGWEDFATANYYTRDVTVFLNQGEGVLGKGVYYELEAAPYSLHAADLDMDGTLDLVAGAPSRVFVLPGRGNGDFAEAVSHDIEGIGGLLISDLNDDEKPDLIVPSCGCRKLRPYFAGTTYAVWSRGGLRVKSRVFLEAGGHWNGDSRGVVRTGEGLPRYSCCIGRGEPRATAAAPGSSAIGEKAQTEEPGTNLLGLALENLERLALGPAYREAGYGRPLAPRRPQAVLALVLKTREAWATEGRKRDPRVDPSNVPGELQMGRT